MVESQASAASARDGATSGNEQKVGELLLVDDEPRVCRGLKRTLRRDQYRVHVAHDAEEAFNVLARHTIDVVVSDQRMPGKKGTDFLREVSVTYPGTVRMILSGAAEIRDVADAMGAGVIYKFLTKPIDPALFRANVIEAFSRARALKETADAERVSDPATGLPTREGLERAFDGLFEAAQGRGKTVCLLMLTVDQYDSVVSSYGRSFAKRYLNGVAGKLMTVLDGAELLGHDTPGTFLMLIAAEDPVGRIMLVDHELEQLLSTPVHLDDRSLSVTLSIGATAADAKTTLSELIDQAHTAMITGKERGGATIQLYQPHLVAAFRDQLELEADLRSALTEKAFELYYQPQIDVASGRIVGLEALLRWRHASHGFVSPAKFIPVAERLGLIEELGDWVLAAAVERYAAWGEEGVAPPTIAVNVSVMQARDKSFPARVSETLEKFNVSPSCLVLEMTESIAIDQNEDTSASIEALHELGIALAVDDFGTGYANIQNLTRFAFQKLKIDRSLLPRSTGDGRALQLYTNIVTMASELGLVSIAEGVETPGELSAVFEAGCKIVQGYFYSPPVSVEETDNLLRG